MRTELLRLIYDYSKMGMVADKYFIEKLITIVVSAKQLNKYVSNLEMITKSNGENSVTNTSVEVAQYIPELGSIKVFLSSIQKVMQDIETFNKSFNATELMFHKNLTVSQFILHEIEHATHIKTCETDLKNTETKILKICYEDFFLERDNKINFELLKTGIDTLNSTFFWSSNLNFIQKLTRISKRNELYHKNYNYAPHERLAQIKSFQEINAILDDTGNYFSNLKEYKLACTYEQFLRGYKIDASSNEVIAPTVKYFNEMGYAHDLKTLEFYDEDSQTFLKNVSAKHSLTERLMFGLPIATEELNDTEQKLFLSNKY